jgi:citronellyl-CoA synthetase
MRQLLGKLFTRASGALELGRGFDGASMVAWLERNARRWPSRPAAISDNGEVLTWSEVNALANVVAHRLRNQGVGRGDRIAVLMANRPAAVAALLGPAKIGAIAVPIDPGLRPQTLCHRLQGVRPRHVVVGEECVYVLSAIREDLVHTGIEAYLWCRERGRYRPPRWAEALPDAADHWRDNPPESAIFAGRDVAAWLHTAGKGAGPRAVSLSHARWAAAATLVGRLALGLTPADRIFISTPLDTALSTVVGLGGALASGASLAMSRRREPISLWSAACACEASVFLYSGELCRIVSNQPATPSDNLHGIRQLAGTGLAGELWPVFRQRFGIERIMELYGEADGNTLFFNLFDHDDTVGISPGPNVLLAADGRDSITREADGRAKAASREKPGRLAVAITPRQALDSAIGDTGARPIIKDVRRRGDRYRLTGDLLIQVPVAGRGQGWRHFRFVGRLDEQLEIDGHTVNPRRVESVLYRHDAVRLCAVHRVTGKVGEERCAAVLETERMLTEDDLQALAALVNDNLGEPERPTVLAVTRALALNRCFEVDRARVAQIAASLEPQYYYSRDEGTYRRIKAPSRKGAGREDAASARLRRGEQRHRIGSGEQ